MLLERNGSRQFEKISRWNKMIFTTISRKSIYAPFAEPNSNGGAKLWFNYFIAKDQTFPLRKFKKLDTPVMLNDLTRLTMCDPDAGLWLEVDEENEKVRLYQEIK